LVSTIGYKQVHSTNTDSVVEKTTSCHLGVSNESEEKISFAFDF
jgi:hypothetical protein